MTWRNSYIVCLFLTCLLASCSGQNDRCDFDEECKDVETCDEVKFFICQNTVEIKKLSVCGSGANTRFYCCKIVSPSQIKTSSSLSSHKNIKLINHAKCGKVNVDKITGGSTVNIGSMPWMALLFYKTTNRRNKEGSFKCGGSLISPKYVLTAAHCVHVPQQTLESVRLGEHQISTARDCADPNNSKTCNNDQPPLQDIIIEKNVVHDDYVPRVRNDIALLRLKTAAILGTVIKGVGMICLPVKIDQTIDALIKKEENIAMTIAGWGYSEDDLTANSDVLKQASVPYLTNDQCNERFSAFEVRDGRYLIQITEGLMCAGGHNKTDACSGDSGGPLTSPAQNDKEIYKVFQQGIVARGIDCASPIVTPGIYTRVFHYMKWILDNLEE